jgi:hypothetical protein
MEADFPAAHSMDLDWFAVDEAGHVGLFSTGEDGHAPEEVRDENILLALWNLRHGGGAPDDEDSEFWELSADEIANRLGLFCYDYGEQFEQIAPYVRTARPKTPVHVDQLPPKIRKACKRIRFEKVNFEQAELVQPLEYFACVYWNDAAVAYLGADGKTVRPIPGKEEEFREFCLDFRRQDPERAKELIFEGMEDQAPSPPKSRPRRPRKRKDGSDGS